MLFIDICHIYNTYMNMYIYIYPYNIYYYIYIQSLSGRLWSHVSQPLYSLRLRKSPVLPNYLYDF